MVCLGVGSLCSLSTPDIRFMRSLQESSLFIICRHTPEHFACLKLHILKAAFRALPSVQ